MRYITIPPDIVIPTGPAKGTRISFTDSFRGAWLSNQKVFGEGSTNIRCAVKLEALIEGKRPGDVLEVEDADYAKLKMAVETASYIPDLARYIISFFDAVEEATTKRPAHLPAPSDTPSPS